MEIEIEDQSAEIQTFSFANTRITSSGGGGSHRPQKEYISFKKTDEKGEPLAGAVFAFYDQTGRLAKIAEVAQMECSRSFARQMELIFSKR